MLAAYAESLTDIATVTRLDRGFMPRAGVRESDSPWMAEGLLTGKAFSRVLLHQTADEVLGWRKQTQTPQT